MSETPRYDSEGVKAVVESLIVALPQAPREVHIAALATILASITLPDTDKARHAEAINFWSVVRDVWRDHTPSVRASWEGVEERFEPVDNVDNCNFASVVFENGAFRIVP